jgi:N-ATPase, AtpR subunit
MSATIVTVGSFLALGVLVGAIHAGLLFRAVTMLAGTPSAAAVIALNAARFGFVIIAFWFVAQQGAAALIAATVGFTLALIGARFVVGRG